MAIQRRQIGTANNKTGTTLTIAVANNPAFIGTMLLVGVGGDTQPSSIDYNGNALTQLKSIRNVGHLFTQAWALDNCPDPSGTITLNYPGGDSARAAVAISVSEVHTLDQSATGTGSSTTPNTGTTGTTTANDEFIWYLIGTEGPAGDAAGAWTSPATAGQRDGTTGGAANTNITISEGYQVAASTGTFSGAKTGITGRDWAALAITLKSVPQNDSDTPTGATATFATPTDIRFHSLTQPNQATAEFGQSIFPRATLTDTPDGGSAQFVAGSPISTLTAIPAVASALFAAGIPIFNIGEIPGVASAVFLAGIPAVNVVGIPSGAVIILAGAQPMTTRADLAALAAAAFAGGVPNANQAALANVAAAAFQAQQITIWHLGGLPAGASAQFAAALGSKFNVKEIPAGATAAFLAAIAEYFIFVEGAIILLARNRAFTFIPSQRALTFRSKPLTLEFEARSRSQFIFLARNRAFIFESQP